MQTHSDLECLTFQAAKSSVDVNTIVEISKIRLKQRDLGDSEFQKLD